jgi:general secretion pathway protein K
VILFATIARELGMTDEQIDSAVQYVRLSGPVNDLRGIALLGLDAETMARFQRLVTALPGQTTINLNAADEEMLGFLFRDPAAAARLVKIRARQGFLSPKDLADEKVNLPWGTSFRSTTFWVRTRATIGGTSQQQAVLLRRRVDKQGKVEVVSVARWRNAGIPAEAPRF